MEPHYSHRWSDGSSIDLPCGKVVCVGRNYADHAKELNNPVPTEPVLFIKPTTAVCDMDSGWGVPRDRGQVHHELELAILIGEKMTDADETDALAGIVGVGLALDLTLRDQQTRLKQKGLPWERAKAFDGSCPLSSFIALSMPVDWPALTFDLSVNNQQRQRGYASQMLFSVPQLLAEVSATFTLLPGDVVLTGTPAGVDSLVAGDQVLARLHQGENTLLEINIAVAD